MTSYDIFHDASEDDTYVLVATGVDGNSADHALRSWAKSLAEAGVKPDGQFLLVPTRNATYIDGVEKLVPQLVLTEREAPKPRPLHLVEDPPADDVSGAPA